MFKQKHRDTACLLNILDSIQKIRRYASSYNVADELYNDSKSFDAVMMNFVIDAEEVWQIIQNSLNDLELNINLILDQ